MINPGTVLQERYLIEKRIGLGGMGAVYLAIDQRFDNFVAIKETFYSDEEFGAAFEREAKILNGLLHPVLPHVSDYFTEGDGYFLVMQFIEGEDISGTLKREGAFPVKNVLRWTDNLLDALDYLHSQEPPIIHRDVKPSNLKLTPRGDIFLLDFGLAKLKNENTLSERSVFGYSRRYSPLEQIQGIGTDARSDIFALAATVYHLLTGNPPIDAIARASAIVAGRPDPIESASAVNEEIPVSIANVLNTALALNAENRFVSANAMRQALKHAVQESSLENVEILPATPLIAEDVAAKIIAPAENEDFPALAAFAAETLDAPAESIESDLENVPAVFAANPQVFEAAPADVKIPIPVAGPEKLGDVPTRVAPRRKRSKLPVFAVVALLAVIGVASAFFIFRSPKTVEPDQATTETLETNANSAQAETFSPPEEQTKISRTPVREDDENVKSNPVSTRKTAETETKPAVEETIIESPHSKSSKTTAKRQPPKPATRDIDTRDRIVRTEPAPDIESIFTGRPSWERREQIRRREERRQRMEEMSEEEWREMRRRRRQQRRQNSYPIPF